MLPRSLNEGRHGGGGLGKRPKSGAHIITPLEITEIRYVTISFFFFLSWNQYQIWLPRLNSSSIDELGNRCLKVVEPG